MLHALYEMSEPQDRARIEGIDADHSQQLYDWARTGKFPMPVTARASAKFHREVELVPGNTVVVDCGHTENHPAVTDSVLRVADLVILHLTPSTADMGRIVDPPVGVPVRDMILRSAPLRATGTPPPMWALMNRASDKVNSLEECRDWLSEEGWSVFTTFIKTNERLKQSVGLPVRRAAKSQFGDVITEMRDKGLI